MTIESATSDEINYMNLVLQPTKTAEDIAEIERLKNMIVSKFGEERISRMAQVISHMAKSHPQKEG
jgi:hypothetical protein